jgi:16S rRNA C967 or C1407 C5-methylase (RsmB/RsmF family)
MISLNHAKKIFTQHHNNSIDMSTSNDNIPTASSTNEEPPLKKARTSEQSSVPRKHQKNKKRFNKRKNNKNGSSEDRNKWSETTSNMWVRDKERTNDLFVKYYDLQFGETIPNWFTEEREKFYDALKGQLPQTWRISEALELAEHSQIRQQIENVFVPDIEKLEIEVPVENTDVPASAEQSTSTDLNAPAQPTTNIKVPPPTPIQWYPNNVDSPTAQNFQTRNSAWQFDVPKALFRKNPTLQQLRYFLMTQNDRGSISRQEAVSMLPPVFFMNHMKPDDRILDMCAAPGSKTAQLMEMLYASSRKYNEPITGYLVGNDNDVKRAYLLVHQMQRLSKIFPNILITNHDATRFPLLTVDGRKRKFTKILADVMCSGDGTLRKSPDLWKRWKPNLGWSLHDMQLRCAYRAYQILEIGGMIVYSTCSLNPIEDEAVVAELIRKTNYGVELVDAAKELPNLNYAPGMSKWVVTNTRAEPISREQLEEFQKLTPQEKENHRSKISDKITAGFFPPTEEEANKMNLHYCMRLLPHRMNTGGFFVAVLRKVSDPSEEKDQLAKKKEVIKNFAGKGTQDEQYLTVPSEISDKICTYYGIDKNQVPPERLIVRFEKKKIQKENITEQDVKKIYYVSQGVSEIITANEEQQKWKILNLGAVIFEHKNADFMPQHCPWRFTQDFVDLFAHSVNESRLLKLDKRDFTTFISQLATTPEDLRSQEARDRIKKITGGTCVVQYVPSEAERSDLTSNIFVCTLKTNNNIMRHCTKEHVTAIMYRVDPSYQLPEHHTKPKGHAKQQQQKNKTADAMQE